jgi:hypothetical protein
MALHRISEIHNAGAWTRIGSASQKALRCVRGRRLQIPETQCFLAGL